MQSQTEQAAIFTYTDTEFNPSETEQYGLDICFMPNRICATVHHQHKVWAFRFVNSNTSVFQLSFSGLNQLLQTLEWANKPFRQVRVFIDDHNYTLVPDALFDAQQPQQYLSLIHKITPHHAVLTDHFGNQRATVVYYLPTEFKRNVEQFFGTSVTFKHQATNLLTIAGAFSDEDLKHSLLIDYHHGFVNVLHMVKNEIRFLNTFTIEADTDLVYFILSVAEQQQLPATRFKVFLQGDISVTSSAVALLKKYVPEVQMVKRLDGIHYPLAFREFQDQQYFLPIHSLLCE